MGKMLKLGNPKKHPILQLFYNINNIDGIYPEILDFSLNKDNLYISEENIRNELWKYSDNYWNINNKRLKEIINNPDNKKYYREDVIYYYKNLLNSDNSMDIASTSYLFNLWNRYKQIYRINQEIEKNFNYDEDIKLLFGIFDKLPFDCFFIEYSDNMKNKLLNNDEYSIFGTFVCYIHDINVEFDDGHIYNSYPHKNLELCDLIINNKTKISIISFYNIEKVQTDGKYIKSIVKEYLTDHIDNVIDPIKNIVINNADYIKMREQILSYIIQSVLYICSDDITTTINNQANELKANMTKIKNKNITISEISYNIPEEDILIKEDVDRRNKRVYDDHEYTGRTNRPHWRKAHWHYYWCGKGKKELRLKFLLPILVNGNRVNEKITTIVRNKTLDIQ